MFRVLRIVVLLVILANVAIGAWLARARSTAWDHPLRVVVFPINADGSEATARYIRNLRPETFRAIEAFLDAEAQRYGVPQRDVIDIAVAPELHAVPPPPPQGRNPLRVALWSLQLRFWAWMRAPYAGPTPEVRMFVLYHDPAQSLSVPHSVGLQKGLIGVVHAFAAPEQTAQNNVVAAHELLHTLGATDKYDLATNQPLHPSGYADPYRDPLLPQDYAELMAGRIPIRPNEAVMPPSLAEVVIGPETAREIRWVR